MGNTDLKKLINNLSPTDGVFATGIEGVTVFRVSRPLRRTPGVYSPGMCILVSGSKKAYLDNTAYVYDAKSYFCCTVAMPVEAEISYATQEHPLLGIFITLESAILSDLAIELEALNGNASITNGIELSVGVFEKDNTLEEAAFKLLQLTTDEVALKLLSKGRLREFYYAVLMGKVGAIVRQALSVDNQIAQSIHYVRSHLHETITVEDMAKRAGMSRAVFHRKFKAATTLSPLQFVKNLKLNYAAKSITAGMSVSEAAFQSGYSSASQFSREFRRQYGTAPSQWNDDVVRFSE